MTDYRAVNLANWNDRAAAHAASPTYAAEQFASDPTFLSEVIRFDRARLGDVAGLRGVHLQCHIGTDTISLSRLGATMTGLDFSDRSLAEARKLAARAGADIPYVQSDVYDAPAAVGDGFDLVYTGVGALCWLPDVKRWAKTVRSLLRPGGRLFIREGHPVLWAVDDTSKEKPVALEYPYFETVEPQVWEEGGTYVETDAVFTSNVSHSWNHGIGEIITAVLEAGMTLTGFEEHKSVPWLAIPGKMTDIGEGEWQLTDRPERLPHTYTLQAIV